MRGDSPAGARSEEQSLDSNVPLTAGITRTGTSRHPPFCSLPDAILRAAAGVDRSKSRGMNFRDVLKALALYPGEAPDARIFGDEVAGIVTAIGTEVTHRNSQATASLGSPHSVLPPTRWREPGTCAAFRRIFPSIKRPRCQSSS